MKRLILFDVDDTLLYSTGRTICTKGDVRYELTSSEYRDYKNKGLLNDFRLDVTAFFEKEAIREGIVNATPGPGLDILRTVIELNEPETYIGILTSRANEEFLIKPLEDFLATHGIIHTFDPKLVVAVSSPKWKLYGMNVDHSRNKFLFCNVFLNLMGFDHVTLYDDDIAHIEYINKHKNNALIHAIHIK